LAQDRLLELSQRWARLEREVVAEQRAAGTVGRQSVRLTPAPVERQHQLQPQTLA
jgi:hypothetical protein